MPLRRSTTNARPFPAPARHQESPAASKPPLEPPVPPLPLAQQRRPGPLKRRSFECAVVGNWNSPTIPLFPPPLPLPLEEDDEDEDEEEDDEEEEDDDDDDATVPPNELDPESDPADEGAAVADDDEDDEEEDFPPLSAATDDGER